LLLTFLTTVANVAPTMRSEVAAKIICDHSLRIFSPPNNVCTRSHESDIEYKYTLITYVIQHICLTKHEKTSLF